MAEFNVGTIISTSVHEAYPGHYVQFLWQPQFPSQDPQAPRRQHQHRRLGPLLRADDARPGLRCPGSPAHGSATDEREAKLIRLGQLQDALLRDARFVNSIKLHTAGRPSSPSIKPSTSSSRKAINPTSVALVETKRGTADATYLYYTLGKLEIMKLREDLSKTRPRLQPPNSTTTSCARASPPSKSSAKPCSTTTHRSVSDEDNRQTLAKIEAHARLDR